MSTNTPTPAKSPKQQENPLINLLVNVFLPVTILAKFSRSDNAWVNMDPKIAMLIAVALPLGYGIWYFIAKRQANFFSALGLIGVLATGLLSLYLYQDDGTVRQSAPQLFAIKEALIPLLLGLCVIVSHWMKTSLLRSFLYLPELFDIERIEARVQEKDNRPAYRKTLFQANLLFAISFLFSAIANYFLALHFLDGTQGDQNEFNDAIAKLTGWGFAVIAAPMMVGLIGIMIFLRNKLAKVTGMHPGEILLIG